MILAIDPGTLQLGFAVLEQDVLYTAGVLKLKPKDPIGMRLRSIHRTVSDMICNHKQTKIAIETPFMHRNAQTFLKLGYVRGIIHMLAAEHDIEVIELSPRTIKQRVTGSGSATKEDVAWALAKFFPAYRNELKITNKHDMTDAIAVGVASL